MVDILAACVLGYLIGSIPFGLLLTRAAGLGDIRGIGSGNIGATNVLRTGNKKLAAATLLLDAAKGAAAVISAKYFFPLVMADAPTGYCPSDLGCGYSAAEIAAFTLLPGAFAVIGHMFPVWLRFKGGKGVATFFGVTLAFLPVEGCVALGIWLLVAAVRRQSSLAALMSTLSIPLMVYVGPSNQGHEYCQSSLILSFLVVLVWWKHHENIQRLLNGTEPKIGQKT